MSRYEHKIETSLEGIEHLSKEKKDNEKEEPIYYLMSFLLGSLPFLSCLYFS